MSFCFIVLPLDLLNPSGRHVFGSTDSCARLLSAIQWRSMDEKKRRRRICNATCFQLRKLKSSFYKFNSGARLWCVELLYSIWCNITPSPSEVKHNILYIRDCYCLHTQGQEKSSISSLQFRSINHLLVYHCINYTIQGGNLQANIQFFVSSVTLFEDGVK